MPPQPENSEPGLRRTDGLLPPIDQASSDGPHAVVVAAVGNAIKVLSVGPGVYPYRHTPLVPPCVSENSLTALNVPTSGHCFASMAVVEPFQLRYRMQAADNTKIAMMERIMVNSFFSRAETFIHLWDE